MMFCNDCHLIGWVGSPDVCPVCGGTDVVMTLGFYTKEELDEIAEERGDEFGICNTGNEVIEPLAHRNDGVGIFYACQDRMPLRSSVCFSAKDLEGIMEDLDVHGCPSWVNPVTWEMMQSLIQDPSKWAKW